MKSSRVDLIEQYILQNGTVSLTQILNNFDISMSTLRRDLDLLERRGHISKTYGGATSVKNENLISMPVRDKINVESKKIIGKLAASLIKESDTIFLDSGSTTLQTIQFIPPEKKVSLLSNSLPALAIASSYSNLNLYSLGGCYNSATSSFVGGNILNFLDSVTINMAFMAATAVSIENGLSNNTYFEAELKRSIVTRSRKIILLADHTKFGSSAMFSFCSLSKLACVVTDRKPSDEYMNFFNQHKIKVLYELS